MKKFISILFLILAVSMAGFSQNYNIKRKPILSEPAKIIMTYVGQIGLQAAGDALKDNGHKQWGHALDAASLGIVLASPLWIDYDRSKWYWYAASYVTLRIGLFDPIYNVSRGLPIDYIGGTSNWDLFLRDKLKPPGTLFARSVYLTIGISIPINELKKNKTYR